MTSDSSGLYVNHSNFLITSILVWSIGNYWNSLCKTLSYCAAWTNRIWSQAKDVWSWEESCTKAKICSFPVFQGRDHFPSWPHPQASQERSLCWASWHWCCSVPLSSPGVPLRWDPGASRKCQPWQQEAPYCSSPHLVGCEKWWGAQQTAGRGHNLRRWCHPKYPGKPSPQEDQST